MDLLFQIPIRDQGNHSPLKTLGLWPAKVERHIQNRDIFLKLTFPVFSLRRKISSSHPFTIVLELMRQRFKCFSVIDRAEFTDECSQAHSVTDDMVHIDVQKVMVSPVNELKTYQRDLTQIKRACKPGDKFFFRCFSILNVFEIRVRMGKDFLNRLAIDHKELGP